MAQRTQTDPYRDLAAAARRGSRAAVAGLLVSAVLAAIKISAGVLGSAYALIADGVESILDVFGALVVLGSLRLSTTRPNERYPFGLGRVEPLGGIVVSLVLLSAAVGIAIESIREIRTPHHAPAAFTLVVLVGVVLAKELLFRRLLGTGAEIGSSALSADAWHHRSDALTSLAAFVGISVALVGGPGYESVDDWAALAACLVIAFNGVRLFYAGIVEVLDVAPPKALEEEVREVALAVPGVRRLDKCRVRKSGMGYFVDIQVVVDGESTVREGHRVGHDVKDALLASKLGVLDVAVHVEPD